MGKFGAWLRLIRVAALPTTLADVWLGSAVVGLFWIWDFFAVSFASLLLYTAGMILNDACDVERDRTENPTRPLPSGEIPIWHAWVAGLVLLFGGVGAALLAGPRAGITAGALALLIVSYDFFLKATPIGPVNMGLCRACNVALGVSIASGSVAVPLWALPVFIYVVAVTYLSRFEVRWPPARRIVALGVIGIIPLQAVVALLYGSAVAAAWILVLLAPIFVLKRLSHIT